MLPFLAVFSGAELSCIDNSAFLFNALETNGTIMDNTLNAQSRNAQGSKVCQALRAKGQVPAILYGKGFDNVDLQLDKDDVNTYFRNVKMRECTLNWSDQTLPVVIADVQRHPISRDVLHLDFKRKS